MSAQPQHNLTYGEIRDWAQLLGRFTASDLAFAMGVDYDTGQRSVVALCFDGICRSTGDTLDGPYGYEPVIQYIPLPAGPSKREPSGPDPERTAIAQAGRIVVERGTPVRIRTERQKRRSLSTPGARQSHINAQREWEKQQAAKTARAAAQRAKAKAQKGKGK